jgi:hypothetical protein
MDDTHPAPQDIDPAPDGDEVAALAAMDPADAPDAADRLADRLQAALDESEETAP